jgi:hypothetical protein
MAMHDKSVVERLLSERRSRRFSVRSALDRVVGITTCGYGSFRLRGAVQLSPRIRKRCCASPL